MKVHIQALCSTMNFLFARLSKPKDLLQHTTVLIPIFSRHVPIRFGSTAEEVAKDAVTKIFSLKFLRLDFSSCVSDC